MEFEAFRFPADERLAQLHREASGVGNEIPGSLACPCCARRPCRPYSSWLTRSLQGDHDRVGSAVVGYFWLLGFYALSIVLLLAVYGGYLWWVSQAYCSERFPESCAKSLGVWVVANEDLFAILQQAGDLRTLETLSWLRRAAFLLLLGCNTAALGVLGFLQRKCLRKLECSDFSLVFHNVATPLPAFLDTLAGQSPDSAPVDCFEIHQLQPFYATYQAKLGQYFLCLGHSGKRAKWLKLVKELQKTATANAKWERQARNVEGSAALLSQTQSMCSSLASGSKIANGGPQPQPNFHKSQSGEDKAIGGVAKRVIVTWESVGQRNAMLKRFGRSWWTRAKHLMSPSTEQSGGAFAEECPPGKEIIWENMGRRAGTIAGMKVVSVLAFVGLLAGSYLLLFFCLRIVYRGGLAEPWQSIATDAILVLIVALALTFRQLMNRLSEARCPETFSKRTLFIVLTTIVFHLLYYLLVPSIQLRLEATRAPVMLLICNQNLTFLLVQVVLSAIDLMYCCWKCRRPRAHPQTQLLAHRASELPRFPIEFKLIVLFKVWSLTIFFAFHLPLLALAALLALLFLYCKDKHAVYHHYRFEPIAVAVQITFLRLYAPLFAIYAYFVFVFTQRLDSDKYTAIAVTVLSIAAQFLLARPPSPQSPLLVRSYSELDEPPLSEQYAVFLGQLRSKPLDDDIRNYLSVQRTLLTEGVSSQSLNVSSHPA